jgi:hypothetical protein
MDYEHAYEDEIAQIVASYEDQENADPNVRLSAVDEGDDEDGGMRGRGHADGVMDGEAIFEGAEGEGEDANAGLGGEEGAHNGDGNGGPGYFYPFDPADPREYPECFSVFCKNHVKVQTEYACTDGGVTIIKSRKDMINEYFHYKCIVWNAEGEKKLSPFIQEFLGDPGIHFYRQGYGVFPVETDRPPLVSTPTTNRHPSAEGSAVELRVVQ